MSEVTVRVEFVGGSRDGYVVRAKHAPDFLELKIKSGWIEVYERQSKEPPFVYRQIGYTKKEQCK